ACAATMPSPAAANLVGGVVVAASRRLGFPAWSNTHRQARCSVAFCAQKTLLPPSWKLFCLPVSQLPLIGRTPPAGRGPALVRNATRSTPPCFDHPEYVKPTTWVGR